MAYRYTCFLFCAHLLITADAQPGVLLSSEMPPPGTVITFRLATDPTMADTSSTGSGVVWDHTGLTATGNPFTYEVLAPGDAPHTASVPGANYAVYESGVSRYSYFAHTPQDFSRVGFHINNNLHTYSDPQIELVFPVALGDTHIDDWANTEVSFPGTYAYECVATGSLLLPGATYSDVLLLRVTVVNLFPIETFYWMDATNGTLLMLYLKPGFFINESVHFASDVTIGMEELADDLGLRLNTLVDQHLHLTYDSPTPLEWTVLDATGRLLREGTLPASGGANTMILDMGALAPGIHLLHLRKPSTGARHAVRFMKE